ncbi:Metallo-dependent phosphatase-like protein, partial [Dunaliella salina]
RFFDFPAYRDFEQGLRTLQLLGAVDESRKWAGGKALLVQLGDLSDRGPNTLKLIDLFEDLKVQAEAAGGKVVTLLGNHSHMLASGDYRYFSRVELAALGDGDMQKGLEKLKQLMSPEGKYGMLLRRRPVAWISTRSIANRDCSMLLVHAAALPHMVRAAKSWLAHHTLAEGGGSQEQALHAADQLHPGQHQHEGAREHTGWRVVGAWNRGMAHAMDPTASPAAPENTLKAMLIGEQGPIWSRAYALLPRHKVCADVAMVCEQMGVSRVIVGHTVQTSGEVSKMCGGQLLMADVALSRAMGPRQLGDVMGLECRAAHRNGSTAGVWESTRSAAAGAGHTAPEAGSDQGKQGQEEVCRWVPSKEGACMEAEERQGELRIWRRRGGAPFAKLLSNPLK